MSRKKMQQELFEATREQQLQQELQLRVDGVTAPDEGQDVPSG